MDEQRALSPLRGLVGQIGFDPLPMAENVQRDRSMVDYCSSDPQVGEGFAVALRIRGVDERAAGQHGSGHEQPRHGG